MKKPSIIALFIFLVSHLAFGQDPDSNSVVRLDTQADMSDVYVARAIVIDGDTLWVANLDEVYIFPTKKFTSRKERRRYTRLIHNIKRVYPWAKLVGETLAEVEEHMGTLETEKEQKAYIKEVEKELMGNYKEDLKKLTITQGRILIKLVDRETGDTSYELVKEMRGNISAVFWQALARLFGSNLKSEYDAKGGDRLIEEIIVLIENGQL
ncbi:hypothetical protein LCGC14_2774920 [marine sediment metagenome]|uniref:DUF4294 domain-containing protein n=1 Tax=marine sediment metagenome TaxID=412755 RepID=A0A0F8ZGY9_9ZZZZ|nr:DUF4294 domain-containing protein [Bacteroides sp.]